jgi:hypothetical protein
MAQEPLVNSAPLPVGANAWIVVLSKATPSGRRSLIGAALVRVLEIGEGGVFTLRVLHASGVPEGHRITAKRSELYACKDPGERAAFEPAVRRLWGNGAK